MKRNSHAIGRGILCSFFAVCCSHAATITYEFTGGSLVPTLSGVPAGVSVTDMSIGGGLDLSGGTDALRFDQSDTGSATGTAIADGKYLSFSVTIAAGTVVNFTSLTAVYNTTLSGNVYSNSRIYSTIDGFDDVTGDTIGVIGKQSPDPTGAGTNVLNLTNPTVNSMRGSNINAGEFDNLTNRTITFYVPWVDNGSGSFSTDLDSLSLAFDVVPEPSAMAMGLAGLLPALCSRRRIRG